MRICDQFEKFVNNLKIGDKLYEYRSGTREIKTYTVEYKHVDYKIHTDSLSTLEILLFIKDSATSRIIKKTLDDAEWILKHYYTSVGPINTIIKNELNEIKKEVALRTKKMNELQKLYNNFNMKINESKESVALKLSELINKTNDAKAKYGDLTVFIQNDDGNKSEESVALKLSESINKLNDAKVKYGDLTVFIKNGNDGGDYAVSSEANDKSTCVVEDVEKILKIFKFYCLQM